MENDKHNHLPTSSFTTNLIAGALAGVFEFGLMYPLDSIRTRMQSLSKEASDSIYTTFKDMIKTEGVFRPMRGVSVVIVGTIPAHALYFGSYEYSKVLLSEITTTKQINYMGSAIVATFLHDVVANPTDVIKQRLQMYNSPYKSVTSCIKDIYESEGPKAFYRSFATQLIMNIPFQAIHFLTYEYFQNMFNEERSYNPKVHIVAGGAAGALAAAVTTPLDVVKTLLNTQETGFARGMSDAARQIYTVSGIEGFFKGITARVLYTMPGTAICWTAYEFFKYFFKGGEFE